VGGKGNMVAKILPFLPQTKIYVEPFGGGASILLARPPSKVEVYNDIDLRLYEFFTVLSVTVLFEEFHRRVALLPFSRKLYNDSKAKVKEDTEDDMVERAVNWFVATRQAFAGTLGKGWGYNINTNKSANAWLSIIEMLPEIHARLQRVQIECNDWRTVLQAYDTPETLFYLDPPYIMETRQGGRMYDYELTLEDHVDLVNTMLRLKGCSVLSGYAHETYIPLEEAGWLRRDFPVACSAAGRTKGTGLQGEGAATEKHPRVESLWVKISEPKQLDFWR
jgi:DNA adenine methylase